MTRELASFVNCHSLEYRQIANNDNCNVYVLGGKLEEYVAVAQERSLMKLFTAVLKSLAGPDFQEGLLHCALLFMKSAIILTTAGDTPYQSTTCMRNRPVIEGVTQDGSFAHISFVPIIHSSHCWKTRGENVDYAPV